MAKGNPEAASRLAQIETRLRTRLSGLNLPPEAERKAWRDFYADPRVKQLRGIAGRTPARSRREEVQSLARQNVEIERRSDRRNPIIPEAVSDFMDSATAATSRMTFGLPERAEAAIRYYLPEGRQEGRNRAGGTRAGRTYGETLDLVREETEAQRERSTGGNVLGTIAGGVQAGGGAVKLVQGGIRQLARVAPRAANVARGATALQEGQRGANILRVIAAGGAGGAAQAAGEGSDVGTGAAYGAAAAPVAMAGIKGAEWVTRPVRDFLRLSSAGDILRRYTNMTAEQVRAAAAEFRRRTNAEPTIFELLPLEDRQSVRETLGLMPGASRETAARLVRERTSNMGPELAARTTEATAGQSRVAARELALDLARSRGADAPSAEELQLARRAMNDPTELENLRATEARNIMGPHDETVAFETVDDMLPQSPRADDNGTIAWEISDPEAANAIRGAAGTLRISENGITVRDVTDIISDLRGDLARGGIEARTAQRAINHLEDVIRRDFPEVGEAMARMSDRFAQKSRMLESMAEGRRTRVREDVPVTSRKEAIKVRQAYDTPEGVRGRMAGQTARLVNDFEASPGAAARAAQNVAESPGTRAAVEGNIGEVPGRAVVEAAEAQTESARRLASVLPERADGNKPLDTEDLVQSLAGLHPSAFLFTKFRTLAMLTRFFKGIPEQRANAIVEALFSQNPATTAAAVRMLNNAGEAGQGFTRELSRAVTTGQFANEGGQAMSAPSELPAAAEQPANSAPETPPAEDGPWNDFPEEDVPTEDGPWNDFTYGDDASYGRNVIESIFPGVEVTDALRDPNSDLGQANPDSFHVMTDGAVDVRPIPGMTFEQFIDQIKAAGHEIVEARDEVNDPSGHATGPHWHVVLA